MIGEMRMKWESTTAYRTIKKGLMESLETRGLTEAVFRDKAEEYLALWVQFQQLKADVEKNGVSFFDERRGMPVENRSVALGVQVSKQMLSIYGALGFKNIAKKAGEESARGETEDLSTLAEMLKP